MTLDLPRGAGAGAVAVFLLASLGYGVVQGGHGDEVAAELHNVCDAVANTAGLQISRVALHGNSQLTREEILSLAGITGQSSLLCLDAARARARLTGNPWISEATVLKLYPGQLQIEIHERMPVALWQKDGDVSVIAADGTVLEPYADRRFSALPLVVGVGAAQRAHDFLALVNRYPVLRDVVEAGVLVAARRWNLRLKSGVDVRLPEDDPEAALQTLVRLDREKKLLSRDIVMIDLRLPQRVTVRLSDAAAQARDDAIKEALKAQKKARKGGHA